MARGCREGLKRAHAIGAGKGKPFHIRQVGGGIGLHGNVNDRRADDAVPARFQFGGQRLPVCGGARDEKAHQPVTKCGARARKLSASWAPAA